MEKTLHPPCCRHLWVFRLLLQTNLNSFPVTESYALVEALVKYRTWWYSGPCFGFVFFILMDDFLVRCVENTKSDLLFSDGSRWTRLNLLALKGEAPQSWSALSEMPLVTLSRYFSHNYKFVKLAPGGSGSYRENSIKVKSTRTETVTTQYWPWMCWWLRSPHDDASDAWIVPQSIFFSLSGLIKTRKHLQSLHYERPTHKSHAMLQQSQRDSRHLREWNALVCCSSRPSKPVSDWWWLYKHEHVSYFYSRLLH